MKVKSLLKCLLLCIPFLGMSILIHALESIGLVFWLAGWAGGGRRGFGFGYHETGYIGAFLIGAILIGFGIWGWASYGLTGEAMWILATGLAFAAIGPLKDLKDFIAPAIWVE